MKIAIRADASSLIGSGHIVRCKTLADELRRRGAEVHFVCREHSGSLSSFLRNAGYSVVLLPAPANDVDLARQPGGKQENYAAWLGVEQSVDADQTLAALGDFEPDWLIVDHYGLDVTWEKRLRPHVKRIFVIDDLANRPHDCDLLLDQNWFGSDAGHRYDNLVGSECKRLLGPRYALLQPVFGQLRKSLPLRDGSIRRVLVFFGAVDSGSQTVKVLQALQAPALVDLAVDVVIGETNPNAPKVGVLARERPGITLHHRLPSLAGLMARADLMLGAGGITTWERCCLGLPAIVGIASENQRQFTTALAEGGVQHVLGEASAVDVEEWERVLRKLRNAPEEVRAYAAAAAGITDGLGVYRVAAVMQMEPIQLGMRRATSEDEAQLLVWANDPEVRQNAFSSESISPETHHAWFQGKLADPDCLLLIGEDQCGLPVGQVRFDCRASEAVVDISIDSALRGRGLGNTLLREALKILRAERREEQVVGEVLEGNHASRSMFLRMGFRAVPPMPGRCNSQRFVLPP